MMVGREVQLVLEKDAPNVGEEVLTVKELLVLDEVKQVAVDGVSFSVREGEVLGVAGVQGNGQTELVKALTGLQELEDGEVTLLGEDIAHATPRTITELGAAHIPEDRQKDGLVLSYPVADNLVLCTYYKEPYAKGVVMQEQAILERANELIKQYDIRTPDAVTLASSLSGGNQQKVIVAREFSRPTKLIVASQPTRGLDVGSIEYIHSQLLKKRDEGTGVLLVSSELDEVMELSDRIAVMYRGKFVAIIPADKVSKEQVGLLMAGVSPEQAGVSEINMLANEEGNS